MFNDVNDNDKWDAGLIMAVVLVIGANAEHAVIMVRKIHVILLRFVIVVDGEWRVRSGYLMCIGQWNRMSVDRRISVHSVIIP